MFLSSEATSLRRIFFSSAATSFTRLFSSLASWWSIQSPFRGCGYAHMGTRARNRKKEQRRGSQAAGAATGKEIEKVGEGIDGPSPAKNLGSLKSRVHYDSKPRSVICRCWRLYY